MNWSVSSNLAIICKFMSSILYIYIESDPFSVCSWVFFLLYCILLVLIYWCSLVSFPWWLRGLFLRRGWLSLSQICRCLTPSPHFFSCKRVIQMKRWFSSITKKLSLCKLLLFLSSWLLSGELDLFALHIYIQLVEDILITGGPLLWEGLAHS